MSVLKSINLILRASRQVLNQNASRVEVFRGLYSAASLGIDGFIQQQEKTKNQLANIQDKFKTKMNECIQEGSKTIVFTEDLKNMVHLAEGDEVNIVIKMAKKFNQQNKELRFGNFIFGPVVMRLLYVLNKPNEAIECFKSPELEGFFDQLISYQLLLDLLYDNQRYDDVLECATILKDRQIEGLKYPRNIVVLALAACYKLNTPQSMEYAMKLWSDLTNIGHLPARRASTFLAGLLLNQNRPDLSLEIISNIRNQNYTTVRNLKVLTLARLNRLEEIIPVLKSILKEDEVSKQTFNKDVLDEVKEKIEKENNTEVLSEFDHILKIFNDQQQIAEVTLDNQLCSEISARPAQRMRDNQERSQFNRFYRPRQSFDRRQDSFERRSDSFERRPDSYERRQDSFERRQDSFERRPSMRAALRDLE